MTRKKRRVAPDLSGPEESVNITIYCRLFADLVPMEVCSRRKRQLDTFGWNSCSGCSVGLVLYWSKASAA